MSCMGAPNIILQLRHFLLNSFTFPRTLARCLRKELEAPFPRQTNLLLDDGGAAGAKSKQSAARGRQTGAPARWVGGVFSTLLL